MGIVTLEGLEFFAYHGFYKEERKMGNKYHVDLSVALDLSKAAQKDKLSETLNYEVLYQLVSEIMKKPTNYLNTSHIKLLMKFILTFRTYNQLR